MTAAEQTAGNQRRAYCIAGDGRPVNRHPLAAEARHGVAGVRCLQGETAAQSFSVANATPYRQRIMAHRSIYRRPAIDTSPATVLATFPAAIPGKLAFMRLYSCGNRYDHRMEIHSRNRRCCSRIIASTKTARFTGYRRQQPAIQPAGNALRALRARGIYRHKRLKRLKVVIFCGCRRAESRWLSIPDQIVFLLADNRSG